jgi:hypothetical protein
MGYDEKTMDYAICRQNAQSHSGEKYGAIYEKRRKVIR